MLETPPKRVRAGFSLAIVTLVVILGWVLLSSLACLRAHVPAILLGFALLGAILLLCQRRKGSTSDVPIDQIKNQAATESEHPLAFLGNSRYWGRVVIFSTVCIFVVCHFLMSPKETIKPQPGRKVAAKVAQPPPLAPVIEFPDLKLTGFVCNGTNSVAVINGSTIGIGQGVENVTLVAVETWGAIVEMNGAKKLIAFGD